MAIDPVEADRAWGRAEEKVAVELALSGQPLDKPWMQHALARAAGVSELMAGPGPEMKATLAQVTPGSITTWGSGQPSYPRQSIANWIGEGYRKNELAFACVQEWAKSSAEPSAQVWRRRRDGDDEQIEDPEHPLLGLMRRPNPFVSEAGWLSQLWTIAATTGNAVAVKLRADAGRPLELRWLRSDRLKLAELGGVAVAWLYHNGEREVRIEPEDIIHLPFAYDPLTPAWGLSPFHVLARAITVDNTATDFVAKFFENAAVPYGLISSDQPLTPEDADDIGDRWQARYGGMEGWSRPAVLGLGAKYEQMGVDPDAMNLEFLRGHTESRICMAFGVPPIIVGAKIGLDQATYSNYAQARKAWWEESLVPAYKALADLLTLSLAADFGSDLYVTFDFTGVTALQEDVNARWKRATEAYVAGFITADEARVEVGLSEMEDGKGAAINQPGSGSRIPVDELGETEPEEPADPMTLPLLIPGQPALSADPTIAELASSAQAAGAELKARARTLTAQREVERLAARHEKQLAKQLNAFVGELGDRVTSRLQSGAVSGNRAGSAIRAGDMRDLRRLLEAHHTAIAASAGNLASSVYNAPASATTTKQARDRAEVAARKIMGSLAANLDALAKVRDARGWTLTQLINGDGTHAGARGLFGRGATGQPGVHDAAAWADRIARTEFRDGLNGALATALTGAGVSRVVIHDGSGLGDECDALNGTEVDVSDPRVGELAHPNCTRWIEPATMPAMRPEAQPATEAAGDAGVI